MLFNPLTPELNPSAQRCLPRFLRGILIFKGLTARRLYKSFCVKGLTTEYSETTAHFNSNLDTDNQIYVPHRTVP
jgi:hypothetical protein